MHLVDVATSSLAESFPVPESSAAVPRSSVVLFLGKAQVALTFAELSLHVLGFAAQQVAGSLRVVFLLKVTKRSCELGFLDMPLCETFVSGVPIGRLRKPNSH